ncbi:hypothetical protein CANINC_001348 [Pichia inconspicua]|uniref:Importin N-terminal domain-containing protein n=1 Tax=Pichia inconspicua TaxID=52247 RepID=A0A4T0X537_9ASCO|nr:hypothetical protein CANINC_001348 [[Candida] inconspicua]
MIDYNTVLQTLVVASSSIRGADQQMAEAQLKNWEAEKGFHYHLQSVYINRELSLQVRWLAVICLKNGVEKYWRPTRINAITKEEKLEIRKRLFMTLDESNNQLTIQNAHLISRICRIDFPVEWPTLFEDMILIMDACSHEVNNSVVKLNNLMIIMNQVLKILCTVRIGKARIMLQTKAPILIPHFVKFYHLFFDQWSATFDVAIMEVGYMFLKCLRRLIADGYTYQHRDKSVQEFMELSLQHFQKLLLLHETNPLELLERYIKCYVKLYYNLVRENACAFGLMSCSINILLTLLSLLQQKAELIYNLEVEADGSDFWEKIAIKSFVIMKSITNFVFQEQRSNIVKQRNDKVEVDHCVELLRSKFFTVELVESLINLITDYYLKLRPTDLESWSDSPEEWFNEEMAVNWEFQVRKCAENYFQDLSSHFNEQISTFIMNKIEQLGNDNLDAISKDATLSIFELSANSIRSKCNFYQLLVDYFIPQALQSNDIVNSKLIKRRVCLIINEWFDEKGDSNVRVQVYTFLSNLLADSNNDIIVKLTAVQTLKYMVDDWEFRKRDFQKFNVDIVKNMLELVNSLSSTECKIFILNTLSVVIERNTPLISNELLIETVSIVPIFWQNSNSANEMIIKNSLLRLLKDITISLNKDSHLIHQIVIPLISVCCDYKSEFYGLLCEDGLELWSSVMKTIDSAGVISAKLSDSQYLQMLTHALVNMTEVLPLVLTIIRSYFLVTCAILDNEYGAEIFTVFASYLKTMKDDAVFLTSSIIEIAIMEPDTETNKEVFYNNLTKSRLFQEIIDYLIRDSDNPYCEIKLCLPILRVMIDKTEYFISNITPFELYLLLRNLVKFTRNQFDPKVRKLFLLGLLSLYKNMQYVENGAILFAETDPEAEIEFKLQQQDKQSAIASVLHHWVTAVIELSIVFVEEIRENDDGDLPVYHKHTAYDDEELREIGEEVEDEDKDNEYVQEVAVPVSVERERFTVLVSGDPVHRVVFRRALRDVASGVFNSATLQQRLGPAVVEELQRV